MKLCALVLSVCVTGAMATAHAQTRAVPQPWWQRETSMSPEGRLTFLDKPWWPRARALKEGERFTLDLNHDGRPDTIVTRINGDIVEAIDDTARAADVWNKVSTTYVVSYDGSGLVDRMVSYMDTHHTGRAGEVELRYFRNGTLRYAWFAESHGSLDAAKVFSLKRWQYAGNDLTSEFRGNTQIYLNKYDSAHHAWLPLSECPFSFWDLDGDGRTEVTLRVSATPRATLRGPDPDYANNYDYMWAPTATPPERMGALNMRLSFNIDTPPRTDALNLPHSSFSFTLVGNQPYDYARMRDFNPQRRAPQTTIHMPWSARWTPALNYPAAETGFTWDEARTNFRWEGQFWIYERDYLSNTGAPTQRWNMRREYSAKPSTHREIYFSVADQRFHLKGAQEAWLEVGHIASNKKDLEFRWWDSTGSGYLDTVEVYRGNDTKPARVAHFDPRAVPASLVPAELTATYGRALPAAIAADEAILAQMKQLTSDADADAWEHAAEQANSLERRRYCLDIARELLYLHLRDRTLAAEAALPYPEASPDEKRYRDPAPGSVATGYTLGDSLHFWSQVRLLHHLDQLYADGQFAQLASALAEVHFPPDNTESRLHVQNR